MRDDSPYERVTNPERFAPLHQAVADLVAELERVFDVNVEAVKPEQPRGAHVALAATRITPVSGAAPVTITSTDFPGLFVRFGERYTEYFPQCGCDACDEQPDDVLADLRRKLSSVAAGQFRELPGGYEFSDDDGGWSSGRDPSVTEAEAPTRDYAAWSRR